MCNDIIYLAGVFDGEGCITAKYHRNYIQTSVSVNGTCYPMIRKFYDVFKFGSLNCTTNREKYNHSGTKDLWRWSATNRKDQEYFLNQIVNILIEKKEQAETLLKFLNGEKIDIVADLKQLKKFTYKKENNEIIFAKNTPHFKLNKFNTLEIYNRLSIGECGKTLAKEYNVSESTISKIRKKDNKYLKLI